MARPRKAVPMRRIELRLATDDPMLRELAQEAQLRGVELTQHIHDLLRSRYAMGSRSRICCGCQAASRPIRQFLHQRQIPSRQQIHLRRRPLRSGPICSIRRNRDRPAALCQGRLRHHP